MNLQHYYQLPNIDALHAQFIAVVRGFVNNVSLGMHTLLSYWWWVNIGLGNILVLPDNRPIPAPMWTQIYSNMWNHYE